MKREINPATPWWRSEEVNEKAVGLNSKENGHVGSCQETWIRLSVERSADVNPSRSALVVEFDDATQTSTVKGLKARGAQNPDLLSLVRNNQASATRVSMAGMLITLQIIASVGAQLELRDVTARLSCGEMTMSVRSAAPHEGVNRIYDPGSFEFTEVLCTHVGDVLMDGTGAGCRASVDELR